MPRRLATWIVLGPVGHLTGGVMDGVELMVRWQLSRLRGVRASSSSKRESAGETVR